MEIALGFLAGFLANTVFGMITRLLPPSWVRYHVSVVDVQMASDLTGHTYTVSVVIQTPKLLRALMEPPMRLYQADGEGRRFVHMCGRIYAEQADYVQRIFDDLFQDIVARFSLAFGRALPEVPDVERAWRVHFSVGAMIHTMLDSERIKRFSNGLCDPSDADGTIERMVRFCAAGLRAEIDEAAAEPEKVAVEQ
ncbi:MAG: hypothetical protein IIC83_04655 [Chloroflexi bacterium]|nr:hypothetical protein [Chloroflexota bacterium]